MPQNCHICEKCPQEILILNCKHNICLQCGYFLYKKYAGKGDIINCVVCGSKTHLDVQTINHMKNSADTAHIPLQRNQVIKQQTLNKTINVFDSYEGTQQCQINIQKSGKQICTDHSQDQLHYICFTCNMQMICPECFINGGHQGHQVLSVKKYIPIVKKNLSKKHSQISALQGKMAEKFNNSRHEIQLRRMKVQQLKDTAVQKFTMLKKSIQEQERLIVDRFDSILVKYQRQQYQSLKKKESLLKQIRQTTNSIQNLKKQIQNVKANDKAKQSSLFCRYKQIAKQIQQKLSMHREEQNMVLNNKDRDANVKQIQIQDQQLQQLTNRIQKIAGKIQKAPQLKQNTVLKHRENHENHENLSPIQKYSKSKGLQRQNTVIFHETEQILFSRSKFNDSSSYSKKQCNYFQNF